MIGGWGFGLAVYVTRWKDHATGSIAQLRMCSPMPLVHIPTLNHPPTNPAGAGKSHLALGLLGPDGSQPLLLRQQSKHFRLCFRSLLCPLSIGQG